MMRGSLPARGRSSRHLAGGAGGGLENFAHSIRRDIIALPPPLNRSVVFMTETASKAAYAAEVANDFPMICHGNEVRAVRTSVKAVETIPAICDHTYMESVKTVGQILLELKERAAPETLESIAKRGGYSGKSSVQEFFKATYEGPLSSKVAKKLVKGLVGLGEPPIQHEEVAGLADIPPANASDPIHFEGASLERARSDLPVFGAALGGAVEYDGEAIELTDLNTGNILEYVQRPVFLNGKENCYALYVQGSSMHPALPDGEIVVVVKGGSLGTGDNVVVYLRPRDHEDNGRAARGVLVKELVRRTASYIELRQYEPDKVFRVATEDVVRIDRILTRREMLS